MGRAISPKVLDSPCCGATHGSHIDLDETVVNFDTHVVDLHLRLHDTTVRLGHGAAVKVRDFLTTWLDAIKESHVDLD